MNISTSSQQHSGTRTDNLNRRVHIRYMGTKAELAQPVAEIISSFPPGACLDLFSGMCSVALALAPYERNAWCNDIQFYAAFVANVLIASTEPPPISDEVVNILMPLYNLNREALNERFKRELSEEYNSLSSSHIEYIKHTNNWQHAGNNQYIADEVQSLKRNHNAFPFRLFTLTYSNGYYGLAQSIDIDSIRYAIEHARINNLITLQEGGWALLALLQSLSRTVAAPGHFAQYFKVRDQNTFMRIRSMRNRNIWLQFREELSHLDQYGTPEWRNNNRVFNYSAVSLLEKLSNHSIKPAVIFADPPYTKDHYSRYYHVLETLVKYDYPDSIGVGRYRPDRFSSPFSLVSEVKNAFNELISKAAALASPLVLTYPQNGLLYKVGGDAVEEVRKYYNCVDVVTINRQHSTMGGSKGGATSSVYEQIIVGTKPYS